MKFLLDQDVPDDLTYLLHELGHDVVRLRDVLPTESSDSDVLRFALERGCLLVTCNRDDFVALAEGQSHLGIIVVVRRKTRAEERAALFRLLQRAGDTGLTNNINFA